MRLTNSDRQAFVIAVMADVPSIPYQQMATDLLMKAAVKNLPPKVREIWNDPALRGFIKCDSYYRSLSCAISPIALPIAPAKSEELDRQLSELETASEAQQKQYVALRTKLRSIIAACSTLKQAQELLPEFAKYLPQDRSTSVADRSMPVVAGVVADLVAAGWPKGAKKNTIKKGK